MKPKKTRPPQIRILPRGSDLYASAELICYFQPNGILRHANDDYCRYFGIKSHQFQELNVKDLIYTKDRERVMHHFARLDPLNSMATVHVRVNLPSGQIRWHYWATRAIFDKNDRLLEYQAVGQDLNGLIQAKEKLDESEQRYQALISKMYNAFAMGEILFDKSGNPQDCLFLEVNPAFSSITGKASKDLIGKRAAKIFPGTESFWIDKCGKIASTGKPVQFDNYSKLFERYFDIIAYSPQKGKFVTVFTDITERVKIEQTLRESEGNFRAIAENANDGILIAVEGGQHVYANHRICQITAYSKDELLAMSARDLVHPAEMQKVIQGQQRFAGKSIPHSYETVFVNRTGESVPVEISASVTVWKGQLAVLEIVRDITRRKRLEEALVQVHNELERRVEKRTSELMETAAQLESNQQELLHHKIDLEKANRELIQTNTALSVLARNINRKRDEVEKRIARTVSSQIIPLVEELKQDKIPGQSLVKLDVILEYLNDLTPRAARGHEIITSLSAMELRIAVMIKNGFSSEEIAKLLNISPHTVKTHRKNIRKKLKLRNSKTNLISFLRYKMGKNR
jgi:PAS domain S-box-containing protein